MHSTSNLEDEYIGSGKRLWNSIRKHGRENHIMEILEWFPDRSSLKNREKELVNESLLQDPICMNLAIGGEGGFCGKEGQHKWSSAGGKANWKSNREKMLEVSRKSGKMAFEKGHGLFGEANPRFTGRTHREETKNKLRMKKTQIGEKNSQFGSCWINKNGENKKIRKEEIESFESQGWERGRKFKKRN
jgi:hypothetical protein